MTLRSHAMDVMIKVFPWTSLVNLCNNLRNLQSFALLTNPYDHGGDDEAALNLAAIRQQLGELDERGVLYLERDSTCAECRCSGE